MISDMLCVKSTAKEKQTRLIDYAVRELCRHSAQGKAFFFFRLYLYLYIML